MSSFINSTSGRLISFSLALGLIEGGVSVHLSAPTSLYVMASSVFVAIVGCVAALELAADDFEYEAIMGAILLPVFLFLYAIGLGVSMTFHPTWSYGFIAVGVASLIVGVRSFMVEKPEPVSAKPMMAAPAHAAEH